MQLFAYLLQGVDLTVIVSFDFVDFRVGTVT